MDWTILTCRPQTEFAARDELHGLGFSALVPVEFRMRQVAKATTFIRRPVLPGYVFVGLTCAADWFQVRKVDGVRLPLQSNGRWATLTPTQVSALESLSQPGEHWRRGRIGHAYRLGDRIRIRRGAMAELEAVIASLDGGQIVAVAQMFGKEHRVKVKPEHVEAA